MGTRRGSERRRMAAGFMVRMDADLARRVHVAADADGLPVAEWFRRLVTAATMISGRDGRCRRTSRRPVSTFYPDQLRRLVVAADLLADLCNAERCPGCTITPDSNAACPMNCDSIIEAARSASDAVVAVIEAAGPS